MESLLGLIALGICGVSFGHPNNPMPSSDEERRFEQQPFFIKIDDGEKNQGGVWIPPGFGRVPTRTQGGETSFIDLEAPQSYDGVLHECHTLFAGLEKAFYAEKMALDMLFLVYERAQQARADLKNQLRIHPQNLLGLLNKANEDTMALKIQINAINRAQGDSFVHHYFAVLTKLDELSLLELIRKMGLNLGDSPRVLPPPSEYDRMRGSCAKMMEILVYTLQEKINTQKNQILVQLGLDPENPPDFFVTHQGVDSSTG